MKRNRIALYTFIALVSGIVINWLSGPAMVVTYAEAKEVWMGSNIDGTVFTYNQVVEIVGEEGEFISTSSKASPVSYRWDNPEGYGFMTANFIDDSLATVQVHIDLFPRMTIAQKIVLLIPESR